MGLSLRVRFAVSVIACCLLATTAVAAEVSSTEAKCAKTLGKGVAKVAKTVTKELAGCRAADISGKATGSCPRS